ncbi:NADH-quinone oxidoreductase subunit 5 family protein [Anaerovorax odorimutans]|uniref:NADH-quinone oxidoreductase subunit 5 family protein n=1 Tax=Anaerovorax odorimutans TaxID=109327 RepID=UPI0004084CCC|nr:proton-conducting transporter membrane subunit [Anaerovorax odorimutans]
MSTITFLILFPLLSAIALLVLRTDAARGVIVKVSATLIAVASIYLAYQYFGIGEEYFDFANETVNLGMTVIEVLLAIMIIYLGIKYKKYLASVLAAIQTPTMIWFEVKVGHHIHVTNNLYVDRLSIIMVLIIGIIGSIITVYALGYMKDFQHHHKDQPDRRPFFFFIMYLFLGAMCGLVLSNNIVWLYFFWEITTLCSFFLIGYTKTEEAINNSFRALIMNLLGGVGFVIAIVIMGSSLGTLELNQLIMMGMFGVPAVTYVAALLAFAGITKAAQMPFNSWLLGAMVAPTPTSALLHSSTMVKAGVFLIIKLAPLLGWQSLAGIMVMMVGGITFIMASFAAVSQSNAKKVLAYSTVANLGLIVACGGIGTYAAVWAGILLIIFHAITKSLLFLCVGTAEHNIGSRDIEDMDGLFTRMPKLATYMIVGISAMFLAPLGMLVSKWAAMKAFIDNGGVLLVMFIAFGSAATLFYWTKWLGKMVAIMANRENIQSGVNKDENFVLSTLTILTVIVCLIFPLISKTMIVPYLIKAFPYVDPKHMILALSSTNMTIMVIMLFVLIVLPILFFGRTNKKIVPIYLAGANLGDDLTFRGAMEKEVPVSLKNWYMEGYFGEKKMNVIGVIATVVIITGVFAILLGGVL